MRYLLGWDYEQNPEVLPAPVPLPAHHVPMQNMPRNISSLVMSNSASASLSVQYEQADQLDSSVRSVRLAGTGENGNAYFSPLNSDK